MLLNNGIAPKHTRTLRFDGINFRYNSNEPWIIKHFNEIIYPGESVALVGASGVGKTTLTKLILGFLIPTEGKIFYDDTDIATIGPSAFRSICGTVLQSDKIFSGAIEENISFFDKSVDMLKIQRAAYLAAIDDEILAFPMKYKTLVGDMGSVLSAGQIQRILLARAIYLTPQLLLLDEATSHLDVKNEKIINNNIASLNITKIIVAHRPETIASADRIIHLK